VSATGRMPGVGTGSYSQFIAAKKQIKGPFCVGQRRTWCNTNRAPSLESVEARVPQVHCERDAIQKGLF